MNEATNDPADVAFRLRRYLDKAGREWNRGLDGWFHDNGDEVFLLRHEEMARKIHAEKA